MALEYKVHTQRVKKYGLEIVILWWDKATPQDKEKATIVFPRGATPSSNSINARIKMRLNGIERKLGEPPPKPEYTVEDAVESLIAKGEMVKGGTLKEYIDKLGGI